MMPTSTSIWLPVKGLPGIESEFKPIPRNLLTPPPKLRNKGGGENNSVTDPHLTMQGPGCDAKECKKLPDFVLHGINYKEYNVGGCKFYPLCLGIHPIL